LASAASCSGVSSSSTSLVAPFFGGALPAAAPFPFRSFSAYVDSDSTLGISFPPLM